MLLGHDVPLVKFSVDLPGLFDVQLADLIEATSAPELGLNNGLPATASWAATWISTSTSRAATTPEGSAS